jgi:hypothetical protein
MSKVERLNQVANWRRAGILSLAIVVPLAACGSGGKEYEIIDAIDAEDMQIILEYAPSQLSFGSAHFRVRTEGGKSDTILYETTISNDGSKIMLENVRPNARTPGYLWLCLNGVEQSDVSVRIELSTGLIIEDQRHCSD